MRNQASLLLGIVMALSAPVAPNQERLAFAIQPLGKVDASLINLARQAISEAFGGGPADTMAQLELPAGAYYEPRKRYRAEKILVFLDRIGREKGIKVIGLTSIDISTTKGRYEDWGIFGMANIGCPSCIVSTYRLGRGKWTPPCSPSELKRSWSMSWDTPSAFLTARLPGASCRMRRARSPRSIGAMAGSVRIARRSWARY